MSWFCDFEVPISAELHKKIHEYMNLNGEAPEPFSVEVGGHTISFEFGELPMLGRFVEVSLSHGGFKYAEDRVFSDWTSIELFSSRREAPYIVGVGVLKKRPRYETTIVVVSEHPLSEGDLSSIIGACEKVSTKTRALTIDYPEYPDVG